MTSLERFESKVVPEPNSGCHLWVGCLNKKAPYGRFLFEGKIDVAHRVAWVLYRGRIPEGHDVDHTCRTPQCVNPAHLEPVLPTINQERRWEPPHCSTCSCSRRAG